MLDKEASVTVNGVTGIISLFAVVGLRLSPEAAGAVVFVLQALAAIIVRQNVWSKDTVSRIK